MIQLSRNYSLPEKKEDDFAIKIIGVGGAGANALDRIVLDGMEHAEMIAVNTDVQSLASSVATQKVQIGRDVTRGLGAGGDPELGYQRGAGIGRRTARSAARRADGFRLRRTRRWDRLRGGSMRGADGARNRGAGCRFCHSAFRLRRQAPDAQATEALQELQRVADAVVCFENDRMGDIVLPKAGIHQAFAVADTTISQSVRAIVNVVRRPGPDPDRL